MGGNFPFFFEKFFSSKKQVTSEETEPLAQNAKKLDKKLRLHLKFLLSE